MPEPKDWSPLTGRWRIGAKVRTPEGIGTITQFGGGQGRDAWYFIEVDGIEDEYQIDQISRV